MLTSQTTLLDTKTNLYRSPHQGATLGSQDGNKSRTYCARTLVQEVSLSYHMHTCIHDGLTPPIQCLCSRKQPPTLLDPLLAATIIPPFQQINTSSPPVYFSFFPSSSNQTYYSIPPLSAPRNSNKDWVMPLKTCSECERDITQWGCLGVVSSSEEVEPVSTKKGRVKEVNQLIQKPNPL